MAPSSAPNVALEQRWGFLLPWCVALKGRIKYDVLNCQENYVDTWKTHLQATLPSHDDVEAEDENMPENSQNSIEEKFQLKSQKTREALALLAAMAHVDDEAWIYILMTHCDVDLGKEGYETRDKKLPVKFILFMDLEGSHTEEGKMDLVKFCGIDQRENPSQGYLCTLKKIAALDEKLTLKKKGVEIEIPVRIHASRCLNEDGAYVATALAEIEREEKIVKEEWAAYNLNKGKGEVPSALIRCTFVLEPMIVDFSGCKIQADTAKAVEKLVSANTRASEVSVRLSMDSIIYGYDTKQVFCRLMTTRFDSKPLSEAQAQTDNQGVENDMSKPATVRQGAFALRCQVKRARYPSALFSSCSHSVDKSVFYANCVNAL